MTRIAPSIAVAVLAILGACDRHDHDHAVPSPKDAHTHVAPHGGTIVDLAGGTGHVEVLRDETAGTLTIHVLDGAMKPLATAEAPVLNLKTDAGPKQITATQGPTDSGLASHWRFQDDALKDHDLHDCNIRLVVGGRSHSVELPHVH